MIASANLPRLAMMHCQRLLPLTTSTPFKPVIRALEPETFLQSKTLTLFMRQVASDTKSCRHALIDEARDQVVKGNKPTNTETGAYTKARQRLTEESLKTLLLTSGNNLDNASPESYLWHQRRVLITDGSTLLMPDTEENQNEIPSAPAPKKRAWFFPFSEFLF